MAVEVAVAKVVMTGKLKEVRVWISVRRHGEEEGKTEVRWKMMHLEGRTFER